MGGFITEEGRAKEGQTVKVVVGFFGGVHHVGCGGVYYVGGSGKGETDNEGCGVGCGEVEVEGAGQGLD